LFVGWSSTGHGRIIRVIRQDVRNRLHGC
jgi:hypothetical protein